MATVSEGTDAPRRVMMGIDLRNRGLREGLIVIALASVVLTATGIWLAGRKFQWISATPDELTVDFLLALLMLLSVIAITSGVRRIGDLKREIRRREAAEERTMALAHHDALTGLPNREFMAEQIRAVVERSRGRAALLQLDLSGFTSVNDLYGNRVGDRILTEAVVRVKAALRPDCVLARVGGDDFAVLQRNIASLDDPTRLAWRIVLALEEPFMVASRPVRLGVKIGIALAPEDGRRGEDLDRRSLLALTHAKEEKGSCVRFFCREMDTDEERRARIEHELRLALAADALTLHYQPRVSGGTGNVIGFEALARWKSPVLGEVPPQVFIPIAEESGMIRELGSQLLRRACQAATAWPAEIRLTFNISVQEMRDPALGVRILQILAETGLDPHRLELDVGALGEDMHMARTVLSELREAGVRIALDGFGSGRATVSQLLAVRFDQVKISREIVQRLDHMPESHVVVKGIVGLTEAMGVGISAVGVETAKQLAALLAAGCQEWQGFHFAAPMPAVMLAGVLRRAPDAGKAPSGCAPADGEGGSAYQPM